MDLERLPLAVIKPKRSIVRIVALNLYRKAQQFPMILLKPFKMSFNGARDLLGILDSEEVTDNLAIVFCLAGQAERGILLFGNLRISHHLDGLKQVRRLGFSGSAFSALCRS
jgi:hypothetical protein